MSDESPPPKPKPGSLRDRIAAFEHKPTSAAPPPPVPRPKPGHVQWKPKTASPPSSPQFPAAGGHANVSGGSPEHKSFRGGMSASDAKESIGLGGSLKERMAALQGKGAFASPTPPPVMPKPASDKPKWKPPPVVHASEEGDHEHPALDDADHERARSSVLSTESASETTDGEKTASPEEGAEGEADPEEEERKRRAAIAARMARLGGARFGMGPAIFPPKPQVKRAESHSDAESLHSQTDAPVTSADEGSDSPALKLPKAPSLTSIESTSTSSARSTPKSMPAPAGPRRAAPPRRRPPKSPQPSHNSLPETPEDATAEKDALPVPTDAASTQTSDSAVPHEDVSTPVETAATPPERDEKKLEDDGRPEEVVEDAAAINDVTPGEGEVEHKEEAETAEEEEDDAARRKRITERIANSGGFNPFAGQRRTSTSSEQTEPETPLSPIVPSTTEAGTQTLAAKDRVDEPDHDYYFITGDSQREDIDGTDPSDENFWLARGQHEASTGYDTDVNVEATLGDGSDQVAEAIEAANALPASASDRDLDETPEESDSATPSARDARVDDDMAPPRITRPLPPTPSESDAEAETKSQVSQPSSPSPLSPPPPPPPPAQSEASDNVKEPTWNADAPPPPPPPPPPPLPMPPVMNPLVRRQSTATHTRGASSPTPDSNRPLVKRNNTISVHSRTPSSPPPVVKRNNTMSAHTRAPSAPLLKAALGVAQLETDPPVTRVSVSELAKVLAASVQFSPPPPPPPPVSPPAKKDSVSTPSRVPQAPSAPSSPPPPPASPPVRKSKVPVPARGSPPPAPPPPPVSTPIINPTAPVPPSETESPPPALPPPPASPPTKSVGAQTPPRVPPASTKPSSARRSPPPPISTVTKRDVSVQVSLPSTPVAASPLSPPPPLLLPPENKDVIPIPARTSPTTTSSDPSPSTPPPSSKGPPVRKYSVPPPPRAPPPPPSGAPTDDTESDAVLSTPQPPQRPVLAPLLPAHEEEGDGEEAEEMREEHMGEIEEECHDDFEQRENDESSDDEHLQDFVSAKDGVDSITKSDFPLTSKWSRDTSAAASAAASVSTLEDSRFPPISSFPPPQPLPFKSHAKSASLLLERKPFGSIPGSTSSLPERGTMDERDGDTINPLTHKATLTSAIEAALAKTPPGLTRSNSLASRASPPPTDDPDVISRRILAKMAKLDGLKLPNPTPFPSAENPSVPDSTEVGRTGDEETRRFKLSSRLLSIGGKRMSVRPAFGSKLTSSFDTPVSVTPELEDGHSADAEEDAAPLSPPKPSRRPPHRRQSSSASSRFVEELPHPPPFLKRAVSPTRAATISFSGKQISYPIQLMPRTPERRTTTPAISRPISTSSSDFVMVEEPEEFDIPRAEWDLPRIPSHSLGFPSTVDLSKPNWAERSSSPRPAAKGPASAPTTAAPSVLTTVTSVSAPTATTREQSSASGTTISASSSLAAQSSSDGLKLSGDELLDLWGRVGLYISDAAATLLDKSRRALVGDGTYPGFVVAVARQVPAAMIPSKTARYPYGHLIYFQTAGTVHKRFAQIMPGDVIVLQNALFKGPRGSKGLLQSYQSELGTNGEPVVGIIGEFIPKKTKVRVYQANQHVGCQTVEYVAYRFEDLKSGTIKIFRVPDS